MNCRLNLGRSVSTATLALVLAGFSPAAAHAQSAGATDGGSADIVVTARKREENAQAVPISITAFSGSTLQKMGVRSFNDLAISNPNVKIETTQGGIGALGSSIAIRGNFQSSTSLQGDPAVGTYYDGHVISRTYGTMGLTVDVESVQTLKGPQGTLFGRNTTGGALLVQTVAPKLGTTEGYVQLEGGERKTFNAGGVINVPLGERVAARLAYQHNERGDYQTFSNGLKSGRRNGDFVRLKLLFEPNDTLKIGISGEYDSETAYQAIAPVTHPNAPVLDNVPIVAVASGAGKYPIDPRANGERSHVEATFFTANIEQQVGDGTVKLLAARRDYKIENRATLGPAFGYTVQDKPPSDDTSVELQYSGKLFNGALDFAAGGFWFKEHLNDNLIIWNFSDVAQSTSRISEQGESYAAYAQATWHVVPKFNLTGGLRYTHDSKSAVGQVANFSAALGTAGDPVTAAANPRATYRDSKGKVNYLISADFTPVEGVMLYASHASGYRASGPNVTRISTVPTSADYTALQFFKAEEIKNYEGGFKAELLDRKLRLNAAYFRQEYKNYQYGSTDPVLVLRRTFNSNALLTGVEVDGSVRLGTGTTISGSYGYVNGKITDPTSGSNGARLPQAPKNTWSATLMQNIPVGSGDLDLVANYSWRGDFFTTIQDNFTAVDEPATTTIDSLGLLSLSATYTRGPLQFSVAASNVTNKKYYTYATVVGAALNFGGVGVPRIVSARIKYSF